MKLVSVPISMTHPVSDIKVFLSVMDGNTVKDFLLLKKDLEFPDEYFRYPSRHLHFFGSDKKTKLEIH